MVTVHVITIKNTCQKPTVAEWNNHHITHPYKRFISLYVHFNGNSTNYSENVHEYNEVFRDAVSCWRKTNVVINGKSQSGSQHVIMLIVGLELVIMMMSHQLTQKTMNIWRMLIKLFYNKIKKNIFFYFNY